jgi:hypothetical protein
VDANEAPLVAGPRPVLRGVWVLRPGSDLGEVLDALGAVRDDHGEALVLGCPEGVDEAEQGEQGEEPGAPVGDGGGLGRLGAEGGEAEGREQQAAQRLALEQGLPLGGQVGDLASAPQSRRTLPADDTPIRILALVTGGLTDRRSPGASTTADGAPRRALRGTPARRG